MIFVGISVSVSECVCVCVSSRGQSFLMYIYSLFILSCSLMFDGILFVSKQNDPIKLELKVAVSLSEDQNDIAEQRN